MHKFKNVAVGISGGVDSAVAAFLLKKKGFNVKGVFMQNWDIADEQGFCSADEDYKDACIVCNKLDIALFRVNFVKQYWNEVFTHLVKDYEEGYTPNPDILCNRNVKFNHFYKYSIEKLDVDAIATGHYATTSFGDYLEKYESNSDIKLLMARDEIKDQTFFLSQIRQEALRKTMFPLGNLTKQEVKLLASKNDLEKFAIKKESMGICFIGSRNFQDFISEYIQNKPGKFIDIDTGLTVGEHNGIHHWTIGQRSRIAGVEKCYYIAQKDVITNDIYVAKGINHPALHSKLFFTSMPHWICRKPEELSKNQIFRCEFKFQHTHSLVNCDLHETSKGLIVRLMHYKKALTPGQYAVFYKNGECLGSARITDPGPSEFLLNYTKIEPSKEIFDEKLNLQQEITI